MVIFSSLSRKNYLSALRRKMSPSSEFGQQRFTGFFAGSCFYVTHHAGYHWNQKFTNQKNAAMGFVKDTENGCQVHFITFRGMFCPLQFLSACLLLPLVSLCLYAFECIPVKQSILLGFILILIFTPIWTLLEAITEESEAGHWLLLSLLRDPSEQK